MLTKLEIYGIILLVVILAAGGFGLYELHEGRVEGRAEIQVKFDQFVNETKAAGLKAEQDKIDKEKQYATQLTSAVDARNTALARLQLAQAAANSARGRVSLTPAVATGSNKICFEPVAFAAAIERYRQRVAGVVGQGDSAQIDAETLIKAWPEVTK